MAELSTWRPWLRSISWMTDVACINKSWKREGSDVEAEAEAVGSGLFQRKRKRKGSFQIFASLPEAEAVFWLT